MTEKEKKLSKLDRFAQIKDILSGLDFEDKDEVLAFIDNEVRLIVNKREKSKENAAKKKEEGDALRQTILDILPTDRHVIIDEIVTMLDMDGVTRQKVSSRLGQLAKLGLVTKETVTTEDKRRIVGYCRVEE